MERQPEGFREIYIDETVAFSDLIGLRKALGVGQSQSSLNIFANQDPEEKRFLLCQVKGVVAFCRKDVVKRVLEHAGQFTESPKDKNGRDHKDPLSNKEQIEVDIVHNSQGWFQEVARELLLKVLEE
jgi:hypothetical protein